jgi:hypothetical protein
MAAGAVILAASPLLADFSYHDKSTITGGMMASLMKVAGVFSKQAREPIETTVAVKGDKMATRSATHVSIIDLDSQTITSVDLQKKTYSVMTFEEMKQALEQMSQRMKQRQSADQPNVDFKISVESTGNTKQIAGFEAKEMVLKMEMQSTDPQSGQQGAMVITSDVWIAPAVPGYSEVRDFRKRMAEKLNWTPSGNMFMGRPDVAKGMAEVEKQAAKLDGMAVFQTVSMGAEGQPGAASSGNSTPQPSQPPPPERPSIGGALGGALGGRLGIGKKKQPSDAPPDQAGSSGNASGSLLEMQMELSGFSSAAADSSLFSVPAGFKKVDSEMKRSR